jgi:protein Mpv17
MKSSSSTFFPSFAMFVFVLLGSTSTSLAFQSSTVPMKRTTRRSTTVTQRFLSDRTMEQPPPSSKTNINDTNSALAYQQPPPAAQRLAPQLSTSQKRILNGLVLSGLVVSTLYHLTHTQVEALVALWEYDLGQLEGEVTKLGVAADVLMRLPLDALHSYESLVPTNPIFYKACTSGVAYALGDFVSQVVQGNRLEDIDLPRSMRSGAAGFIGHGPLCHYWLTFMESYLDFNGAWWATGIKVTADLTVWSIFLCASYSFLIGMLELRDPRDVWKDVKATTWPALKSAWRFWPFVHTISFSHAVPMDLKLLWVDAMEVVWVTILSKVANEDKDAARQLEEEQGEESTMAMAASTTEDENQFVATSQKVFAACWPLLAMWPVLYAGYQLEVMLGLEV